VSSFWDTVPSSLPPDSSSQALKIAQPVCGTWERVAILVSESGKSLQNPHAIETSSQDGVWVTGNGSASLNGTGAVILHYDQNGLANTPFPSPYAERLYLYDLTAVSRDDTWAVGSGSGALILHWNGVDWSMVDSPDPGLSDNHLYGVAAVSANDVWAVGRSGLHALRVHWDGAKWTYGISESSTIGQLNAVAAVSENDVWAVGQLGTHPQPLETLIEHWNGSAWNVVPSPNPCGVSNQLFDLAVASPENIWAVGSCNESDVPTSSTAFHKVLIVHWDGLEWDIVPGPDIERSAVLNGIAVAAEDDIWAIGFEHKEGLSSGGKYLTEGKTVIIHWDGTKWSLVPNPGLTGLSQLAVDDQDHVWVANGETQPSSIWRFTPCGNQE
jgi:hypothetical protein